MAKPESYICGIELLAAVSAVVFVVVKLRDASKPFRSVIHTAGWPDRGQPRTAGRASWGLSCFGRLWFGWPVRPPDRPLSLCDSDLFR